jgi:hypothetical protein
LGQFGNVYYNDGNINTAGVNDYAVIKDFDVSDLIQLTGSAGDYSLGSSPLAATPGTAIYYTAGQLAPELIAVVQGPGTYTLSAVDTVFV